MNPILRLIEYQEWAWNSIYEQCIRLLSWLSSDISPHLGLSNLSAVVGVAWLMLFSSWFFEGTFSPKEDSLLARVFSGIWRIQLVLIVLSLSTLILTIWVIYQYHNGNNQVFTWIWKKLLSPLILMLLLLTVLTIILGWLAVRNWLPKINYWVNERLTKKGYQQSGYSDIREIGNEMPDTIDYDPKAYWDTKNQNIFIGLTPDGQPIRIPFSEWSTHHQQVLGTTGFGKGVAVSNQLAQCLALGETVMVFDPKSDEWCPSVLIDIAEQYDRPVCVLDLNSDEPQLNPLYGANGKQFFDLFVGSFGLAEGRGDADYFRSHERRVVRQWMAGLEKGKSLTQLAEALSDAEFENATKLCNDLTELAILGCINTSQKGAWYDIIDQGGLVYIVGSIRSEPVLRLQKMMLLRLMQRLEQRDRSLTHTHVTIFLDELKYLLCKPSLQALGTIRDKSANVVLAHQSIDDLLDVPADLEPQAVKSAVLENTALKLIYRSQDPDTVEWIAKRSGTIPAHREMVEQSRNEGFSEITGAERRLLETERYLIDANTILSLPKRCGIWFSTDPAQVVLTSPVKTSKRQIEPDNVDPNQEPELEESDAQGLELFS